MATIRTDTVEQARSRVQKLEAARHRLETDLTIKGREEKISIVKQKLSQARHTLSRLEEYDRQASKSYDLDGV